MFIMNEEWRIQEKRRNNGVIIVANDNQNFFIHKNRIRHVIAKDRKGNID